MESNYYSVYDKNISMNYKEFHKELLPEIAYGYAPYQILSNINENEFRIKFNEYIDNNFSMTDNNEDIIFRPERCCQKNNISVLPTVNSDTNINVNHTINDINNVMSYNDISFYSDDLQNELDTKTSLQFTSQAIDTYIENSLYVRNNFVSKIVSISNEDYSYFECKCQQYANDINHFISNGENINSIPSSIHVQCQPDDELVWRSDSSLKNMYNLPMILVSYTPASNENFQLKLEKTYNGAYEINNKVMFFNYDESFNYTASKNLSIEDLRILFEQETNCYAYNCINDITRHIKAAKYYFYIVNLTTEFIHFRNVAEYNFNGPNALILPQYTLVVFNESVTTHTVMNIDDILNEFVKAWKIKNRLYTVDDIRKLVNNLKENYDKYTEKVMESAMSHCKN